MIQESEKKTNDEKEKSKKKTEAQIKEEPILESFSQNNYIDIKDEEK